MILGCNLKPPIVDQIIKKTEQILNETEGNFSNTWETVRNIEPLKKFQWFKKFIKIFN